MIHYNLICSAGHEFSQWFDNMADFDSRKEDGSLTCPQCGSTSVSKALMAPRLAGAGAGSGGAVGSVSSDAAPACPMMAPGGHGGGCGCC